jgi:hypothetical protein
MSKILFQQDKLTVGDDHVKVGETTLYYSSISGVTIFDGKPLRGTGIHLLFVVGMMVVGGAFFTFFFGRIFGPMLNLKILWIAFVPLILFMIFGAFWCMKYDAKVLYLIVSGQQIGVLKSSDRSDLERAKAALEIARTTAR